MAERLYIADLKKLLDYDPLTGVFTWRTFRGGTAKAGSIAGGTTGQGYIQIRVNGVFYRANRLAWFYMTGTWPTNFIDHIDRNKTNNTFSNLREVTNAENKRNGNLYKNNTSGLKGAYWNKRANKWVSMIRINGAPIYLGYFDSAEQAHEAFRNYALSNCGEHYGL